MGEKAFKELIETLFQMQKEVERVFRELWSKVSIEGGPELGAWEPPADVIDQDEDIVVLIDIPGFSKEQIKVKVTEDAIEVQAKRPSEQLTQGKYLMKQRIMETLYKRIEFPAKVRAEHAKARLENGVLEVRVPKISIAKEIQVPIE